MSTNRNRSRSRPAQVNGAVLHLTTPENGPFDEREVLFTIDGTEYTVMKRVPAGAALQYIGLGGVQGADVAIIFALRYALGDTGYNALCAYKALTNEQLATVTNAVRAKFDGALVGPKVPLSNGSAPSSG